MKRNNLELFTNASNVNCSKLSEIDHCFDIDKMDNCGNSYMELTENNSFACKWNKGSDNGIIKSRCEPSFSKKCKNNIINNGNNNNEEDNNEQDNNEGDNNEEGEKNSKIWIIVIIGVLATAGIIVYIMSKSKKPTSSSNTNNLKPDNLKPNKLDLNRMPKK
jgi:hypothetical protein